MDILKVLSRLLDYPSEDIQQHQGDIAEAIDNATQISPQMREALNGTLRSIYDDDLLDAQERYCLLFDQGRALSLHLFEHVHGESRDRGQAMVDLMELYEGQGFAIERSELPDFIPLFLEFLATLPELDAREWLADVSHILARLAARLEQRDSSYSHTLSALLMLCGKSHLLEQERSAVSEETRDDTPEALDKEWEEAAVSFSAPEDCGHDRSRVGADTQAIQWVDPVSPSNTINEGRIQ